ncbi:MAG: hypothetical protein OEY59_13375 [Deltaproteobacteria bacterium]|nr:hypothetical protein [Deltaproteobacteria bacterium]
MPEIEQSQGERHPGVFWEKFRIFLINQEVATKNAAWCVSWVTAYCQVEQGAAPGDNPAFRLWISSSINYGWCL